MKKIYMLGCALFLQFSTDLSAQVIFSEDFSSATGTTPPTGWVNNEILTGGGEWFFDNPGFRTGNLPMDEPFAVFDSDYLSTNGEEAALESPAFDASGFTGNIFLSFDHYFNDGFGGEYHVEVYNGTAWVEVLGGTTETPNSQHEQIDITDDVDGATNAQVRFRWVGNYSWYWLVDNVTVQHYNCPGAANKDVLNETVNSLDLTWNANATVDSWTIEWGVPGFAPGTGAELGTFTATSPSYDITSLAAATTYEIYFQSDCGAGDFSMWSSLRGRTLCAPSESLPWSEDFESMATIGGDIFPDCWNSENAEWGTDNGNGSGFDANSGTKFAGIYWASNDHLWTPGFDLTAGRTYEFSFMMLGDGYDGWSGEVVVNTAPISDGAAVVGAPFINSGDYPNDEDYQKYVFCFTPTVSGNHNFGIHVNVSSNPYFMAFDDFYVHERGVSAGTNAIDDICQSGGLVDLNSLINAEDAFGEWMFDPNPNAIVNDTMLNPQFIPAGLTVNLSYIATGCLEDTVTATFTIFPPSSAGIGSEILACRNEPIDLLSGLSGTVDLGGDWYDTQNIIMPNSQVITGNFPGSFNYDYITGNGVCPNDTSGVVITVSSCNWLSVEENALEEVTLYPNPSTGLVYIESASNAPVFNLVITDINGRMVETGSHSITNGVNAVNLNQVQKGVYFFKLSAGEAEKVYRVVIQ
ncbi:hypothetical protein D3C87_85330 [compost metagenome]